jgi:hypothetical protein
MKLLTFDTYAQYVRAQQRTSTRRGGGVFFTDLEIARIARWLRGHRIGGEIKGICHGARGGHEVAEFRKYYPAGEVIGTDITPREMDLPGLVMEWDFSHPKDEWKGKFDFVYTNSLDHSSDPPATLAVWMEQLNERGRLFMQWSAWHEKVSGGDCFGASLAEYMMLVDQAGQVEDLLYIRAQRQRGNPLRRRGTNVVVLVGKKK